MKKLKQKEDESPGKESGPGDYYMIAAEYTTWYVSPETAARVGRDLERRWRPRWIKFVDLHGGRVWVRSDTVECISESTKRHRTGDRQFEYLRRKEERSDRRWDVGEEP